MPRRRPTGRAAIFITVLALAFPVTASGWYTTIEEEADPGFGGVALDPTGNVYATTSENVEKYTPSGDLLQAIGSQGTGDGQFDDPRDVAIDSQGNIFVLDRARLQRFDPSGTFAWSAAVPAEAATKLSIDELDRLWAVEPATGKVKEYSRANGSLLREWDAGGAQPVDAASDGLGNLWLYLSSHVIRRYSPSGAYLGTHPGPLTDGSGTTLAALAAAPGGILIFGTGPEVLRYGPDGTLLGRVRFFAGKVRSIAATGSGLVYVNHAPSTLTGQYSDIRRIDTRIPFPALTGPSGAQLTGHDLTLDASPSLVPLSSITRFDWDIDGNGSFERDTGTIPTLAVSYRAAGVYRPRVRVVAPSGESRQAEIELDVRTASPPGPLGITINDGAQFTNSRHVTVSARWPLFAQTLLISNDGGFLNAASLAVAPAVPWTLDGEGAERLPRTVYVRFQGGESGAETYQDDIVLDESAPQVTSAVLTRRSRTAARRPVTYRLRLRARDEVSGVAHLQTAVSRRRPGPLRPYRRSLTVRATSRPRFVRVRDRAGNFSKWRRLPLRDR